MVYHPDYYDVTAVGSGEGEAAEGVADGSHCCTKVDGMSGEGNTAADGPGNVD